MGFTVERRGSKYVVTSERTRQRVWFLTRDEAIRAARDAAKTGTIRPPRVGREAV